MSKHLENQLREALRPVAPPDGFAERVIQRIDTKNSRPRPRPRFWSLPIAIAASALVAVIGVHSWQAERERRGFEARQQLIDALRMTGEKLDLAYRGVNDKSANVAVGSGA